MARSMTSLVFYSGSQNTTNASNYRDDFNLKLVKIIKHSFNIAR